MGLLKSSTPSTPEMKAMSKSDNTTASDGSTSGPPTPPSTTASGTSTPIPGAASKDDYKDIPKDGQTTSDSSKLKTFLGILKRFIGVSDMAAVRFSLPAQLMEPIPNLEYWHYLDRPDTFAAIGDSKDDLGRMLACLRFWFTKDLKYVKGKPCKPYNSTLGEFFRCTWEIEDSLPSLLGNEEKPPPAALEGQTSTPGQKVKISYLTEQTSHHPPVSAYYVACPEKGVSAYGFDQLSAKFTGTSVRVTPGEFNEGIFIKLHNHEDETYRLTHPAAYLGGFLRGNLNITVADTCFVICQRTGLKVILHYLEEGYFGKTQNKVEGVIYRTADPEKDTLTRIKDVADKDVLGRIDGSWQNQVYFSPGPGAFKSSPTESRIQLVDVAPLFPHPKACPPAEHQLPNESRRFWNDVTDAIMRKEYARATTVKQELEEKQRAKAAERKAANIEWKPRFFTGATEPRGRPVLTEEGWDVMRGLHSGEFGISEPREYAAM
ncbi:hypothetical protein B0A48_15245 [Cryoendolithus antarcticus]|uniref:Oxysterol-binding protein-like protein 1 n=1 Tax=Cryoendolithus antarcticus TaxID=1507870 RepID=A0A1V8SII4_9PEZI|nr:hypothetical protein B0A48_15245 [Cryoendolithus antarcticus]